MKPIKQKREIFKNIISSLLTSISIEFKTLICFNWCMLIKPRKQHLLLDDVSNQLNDCDDMHYPLRWYCKEHFEVFYSLSNEKNQETFEGQFFV